MGKLWYEVFDVKFWVGVLGVKFLGRSSFGCEVVLWSGVLGVRIEELEWG